VLFITPGDAQVLRCESSRTTSWHCGSSDRIGVAIGKGTLVDEIRNHLGQNTHSEWSSEGRPRSEPDDFLASVYFPGLLHERPQSTTPQLP
jgi:hypothetical protein